MLCAAAVVAMLMMLAIPAAAHNLPCTDDADGLRKTLAERHGEAVVGLGVAGNGESMFELLTSVEGETWTLLIRLPDGRACLLASGKAWTRSEYQPPKQGSAS